MKALGSAISIATMAVLFAAAAIHPAMAFASLDPPSVPEPSPIIGIGAGVVVLGLLVALRVNLARRRATRIDS